MLRDKVQDATHILDEELRSRTFPYQPQLPGSPLNGPTTSEVIHPP